MRSNTEDYTLAKITNDGIKCPQPEILITGVGHSGTTYTAKLLKKLGLFAGHESYYSFPFRDKIVPVGVDVSWIGAWYLNEYNGEVFHQVRDPLKVLNSNVRTFEEHDYDSFRFMRALADYWHPDLWYFFSGYMCQMYEMIEWHSQYTYKVEDMGVDVLKRIFGERLPATDEQIKEAIGSLSKKTNSHTDKKVLSWDDVPDNPYKDKLMDYANGFGYSVTP